MSRRARWFVGLGFVALGGGCAGLPERPNGVREVSVEAEGWAPTAGQNLLSMKHRALAEAQKKAVEKVVGVTLRANTKVEDAVNIKQSIEANMGGTIRRYDVLSERAEGDFFKVRIRAIVLYHPKAETQKLKATRFFVRIANEKVASAIRTTLVSYDYPLGEADQDADVFITGVVETYGRADLRLGGFYSTKANLSLSILDLRSGKMVERSYEASAVDLDDRTACDSALEQAGQRAGLDLVTLFNAPVIAGVDAAR